MNCHVNATVEKLLLDFLREKALAADFCEGTVKNPVAPGGNHGDLDLIFRQVIIGGDNPRPQFTGLRKRQFASSRAYPHCPARQRAFLR